MPKRSSKQQAPKRMARESKQLGELRFLREHLKIYMTADRKRSGQADEELHDLYKELNKERKEAQRKYRLHLEGESREYVSLLEKIAKQFLFEKKLGTGTTPAPQPAPIIIPPTPAPQPATYTPILPLRRYSQMAAQQLGQIILDNLKEEEHYFFDDVDRKDPGVYNLSGWILENENKDFNQTLSDSNVLELRDSLRKTDTYDEKVFTKEYKKKWINFHDEPGIVEMTQAIANLYGIEDGQDVDVMFSYKSWLDKKPDKVSGKARIVKDRVMVRNEWRWDVISLDGNDRIASIIKKYMPNLGDFRLSPFYIEKR